MSPSSDDTRGAMLATLVEAILSLDRDHPLRVGVDGRSAAGKTTLADALAAAIKARGREVSRASIDDFHRPGHKGRSQRHDWTPQSRYDEGYNYDAFVELLLRPLGPGGNRRCRPAPFDSFHDTWLPEEWWTVGTDAIVIIDGVFLQRPELADHWDYLIWFDIDSETMVERARQRDVAWVGSEQEVVRRCRELRIPTHDLYQRLTDPSRRAHAVIDNRNPDAPRILRLVRP